MYSNHFPLFYSLNRTIRSEESFDLGGVAVAAASGGHSNATPSAPGTAANSSGVVASTSEVEMAGGLFLSDVKLAEAVLAASAEDG